MPSPRKKPAAIGIKAAYPGFIPPALATSINKVPSGERWIHEIKFDGYRVQVHLKDAAEYITELPKAEHDADERQAAMQALLLLAEHDGPPMFARASVS
jgi:bifunctional non-homologous end joining protein LigD